MVAYTVQMEAIHSEELPFIIHGIWDDAVSRAKYKLDAGFEFMKK
jgi:hypothetical protein